VPYRPDAVSPTAGAVSPDVERNVRRVPALDGIRAVAIALVLLFHGGFTWAGGGFLGVDVFFVLSGFLITGLLVAEFRQHSGIALTRFWGHRVRRLLPALLLMLLGVAAWAAFLAPPDVLDQVRRDAVATLLYGNNWNQISSGQGYFAALNTPRPLVHTWSLSIEEQFYLVWPLVVLGVLRWTRSRRVLFAVSAVGAVASALEMAWLYGSGAGATRAYYVARVGGGGVGYAGLMMVGGEGHVTTIGVDPHWQRKGIGRRLLLKLAKVAVSHGIEDLTLEVRVSNVGAQTLYHEFGFAPAGIRKNYYAEVNEDAIVMWAHEVQSPAYSERLDAIEERLATS
jgi:ribosomal-protein-alanine acetyltransferase